MYKLFFHPMISRLLANTLVHGLVDELLDHYPLVNSGSTLANKDIGDMRPCLTGLGSGSMFVFWSD